MLNFPANESRLFAMLREAEMNEPARGIALGEQSISKLGERSSFLKWRLRKRPQRWL